MVRCSSNSLSRCTEPLDTYPADSSHSELAQSPAKAQPRMTGELHQWSEGDHLQSDRKKADEFGVLSTLPCPSYSADIAEFFRFQALWRHSFISPIQNAHVSKHRQLGLLYTGYYQWLHHKRTHTFCILPWTDSQFACVHVNVTFEGIRYNSIQNPSSLPFSCSFWSLTLTPQTSTVVHMLHWS